MATWQIILIILAAIVMGSVLGFMTIRMIFRIKRRRDYYNEADRRSGVPTFFRKMFTPELISKKPTINSIDDKLESIMQERNNSKLFMQSTQTENSGIYAELIYNLSIATTPPKGKLSLFQTNYWDSNDNITEKLLDNHIDELTQAYTDIRLANNIVWWSNELGHTSPALERSYLRLCTKIANRLKNIISSKTS